MIGYTEMEMDGPYPRGNMFYIDPMNEYSYRSLRNIVRFHLKEGHKAPSYPLCDDE